MRLHRLAPAAIGLALVATSASITAASAHDLPAPPANSAPQALEALEQVQEILDSPKQDADLTQALLELRQELPGLDKADRREARKAFARPSAPNNLDNAYYGAWDGVPAANQKNTCDAPAFLSSTPSFPDKPFCVHWVNNAASRHYASDAEVADTVATLDAVWQTEIGALGYRTPISDGTYGGGDGKVDIYLSDTMENGVGLFGYAVPEGDPSIQVSPGYVVLENDFTEVAGAGGTSAEGFRRVTAAHEFFHLVQFAYDADEDPWLMESTATWAEERVFTDVNDNRNYIGQSSLPRPAQPVDYLGGNAEYGNWVFHELLTQRLGVMTMRSMWDRAAEVRGPNVRDAVETAVARSGSSLLNEFRQFSGAGLAPQLFWAEGGAYPAARINQSWTLRRGRSTGLRTVSINHLASADYLFRPHGALGASRWKLRLKVDAPSVGGTAYAIVFYKDGSVTHVPIGLNRYGNATVVVPFSSSTVDRVGLALGNATASNGRTTAFKATVRR